jgi:AraC-like DNA-binding protein
VAVALRSHLVPILVQRARRLGVAIDDLVHHAQIADPSEAVTITCAAFRELADAIAARSLDPHFGFHAALEMPRGAYGLVEYVVRNTPTLEALIAQLVRFSRLINAQLVATFDPRTGRLEQRIDGETECLGKQGNEFSLAHQVQVVRDACGKRVTLECVFLAHAAPTQDDDELLAYFGTPRIVYACGFNGVILTPATLATPMLAADPSLFRLLEQRAAELAAQFGGDDELAAVRRAIASELETGEPIAKRIAKLVGVSERTLHRRLASKHTTFGTLVDHLRHKLAIAHLGDPQRSIADVALLCGYSDGRAFARAFRRWTNTTPHEWRKAALP